MASCDQTEKCNTICKITDDNYAHIMEEESDILEEIGYHGVPAKETSLSIQSIIRYPKS